VDEIVPALCALGLNARAFGNAISPKTPLFQWEDINQVLRVGDPVVWHAHRPPALRKGLRLRKAYPHLRVIWTHHGWKAPGWFTQRALKKADHCIALTESGQEQLPSPSLCIPHGTSMNALALKDGPPFLLGVLGRIRPDKGHQDITEAFLAVSKDHPDWQLVFCGEIRPAHQRFAHSLIAKGQGRIEHWPYTIDKSEIYSQLSAVVMPSHAEGFSLVVPEALASGRALLASRLPHFSLLFKEEVHALCFEPANQQDLALQLGRLLSDASLRKALASRGRQHAQTTLHISKEAHALAELYAELVNQSKIWERPLAPR
jgi:mannosyltransferase